MIEIKYTFESTGTTLGIARREWNNIFREAYHDLGVHFFFEYLPKRFTYAGGKELGFANRTAAYNAYKMKRYGHINPLVQTGRTKRDALRTQRIKAVATTRKARVEIILNARALNFRNPKSNTRPSDEVRRISPREHAPLIKYLQERIGHRLEMRTETTKVTV